MLTVALDATPLLGNRTGIGVAVEGFVRHLARRQDLRVVGYGLTTRGRRDLAGQLPPGARPAAARPLPASVLLRVWSRVALPPAEVWTGPVDVVHGTNYVLPPPRRAAGVVTVWDLTPVRYPELSTPTSRLYPGLVARALERGAWVHTGSRFVADEVIVHFGADRHRVRVIAPGIDPAAPVAVGAPPAAGRPYVLGLGTTEPRKDFPSLVRAFDLVADSHPDLELRLAGPPGWAEDALVAAIASARHRDRIHRLGWVADRDSLVAGATVFAYPSLYEGFGLPPLEAMARGVPVVATAAGAVPEVVGDAALLVPPGDTEALAAAIARAVDDDELAGRLRAAGPAQAARFTWVAAAEGMAGLYRDASGA